MSCGFGTGREYHLMEALRHLMRKNHELNPARCSDCREVAAFLTVPGYRGNGHPEIH